MFFEKINLLMGQDADVILTIRKTGESTLTVAAHTKMNGLQDQAQHYIAPFTAAGTPEELDADFVSALGQSIPKAKGLLTNMKHFEQQLKIAEANNKAAQERKDKEAKEAKEKKEKSEKFRKKAEEQIKAGKLGDAMVNLRQARLYAEEKEKKTIGEKIKEVQDKMCQGSLFGKEPQRSPASKPQPAIHPQTTESVPDYEAEDDEDDCNDEDENNDPYGTIVDFPEECRMQDPCQTKMSQSLF